MCVCVLQPTRTVCQIWCSPWRASGWWAPATTRAWAGCAPRAAACWGGTTSPHGPLVCSILHACLGASISRVVACRVHFRPDTLFRYDHETQHAFVGDYSGQITLLKLEKQTYSTITTLKGHEGKDTPACTLRIMHTALSFPPSRADSHLVSWQAGWLGNFCAQAGFWCSCQICRCDCLTAQIFPHDAWIKRQLNLI